VATISGKTSLQRHDLADASCTPRLAKQPGPPLVLLRRGEHALSPATPKQGSPGCSATWVYRRQGGGDHFGPARVTAPRPRGCLLQALDTIYPKCLPHAPVGKATGATLEDALAPGTLG